MTTRPTLSLASCARTESPAKRAKREKLSPAVPSSSFYGRPTAQPEDWSVWSSFKLALGIDDDVEREVLRVLHTVKCVGNEVCPAQTNPGG